MSTLSTITESVNPVMRAFIGTDDVGSGISDRFDKADHSHRASRRWPFHRACLFWSCAVKPMMAPCIMHLGGHALALTGTQHNQIARVRLPGQPLFAMWCHAQTLAVCTADD